MLIAVDIRLILALVSWYRVVSRRYRVVSRGVFVHVGCEIHRYRVVSRRYRVVSRCVVLCLVLIRFRRMFKWCCNGFDHGLSSGFASCLRFGESGGLQSHCTSCLAVLSILRACCGQFVPATTHDLRWRLPGMGRHRLEGFACGRLEQKQKHDT